MQQLMRKTSEELRFEDAACLLDAIQQLENQNKDSGVSTQPDNFAHAPAPASLRANAGLPQVDLDFLDPGEYNGISTFGSETVTMDFNAMSTNSGATVIGRWGSLEAFIPQVPGSVDHGHPNASELHMTIYTQTKPLSLVSHILANCVCIQLVTLIERPKFNS